MAGRSVNKVILVGNLAKDGNTAFTPSGIAKTNLTVVTSRRWKDKESGEWKEEADFTNVVVWRQENLANYLQKGKQVYVEGRLSTRSYEKDGEKKWITEVVADDVLLLGGNNGAKQDAGDEFGAQTPQKTSSRVGATKTASFSGPTKRSEGWEPTEEDLPF